MFTFTSLLGAQSSSSASQSLLELEGGVKILIDVGWDESFDPSLLDPLEKHTKSISLILLTHATTAHLAAYAHCCKHIPSFTSIPVYATAPVKTLGRALIQDLYLSNPLASSSIPHRLVQELAHTAKISPSSLSSNASQQILLQPPSTAEIISYFNSIRVLDYFQPQQPEVSPLSPTAIGLTITAYSAGHSLGGSLWHIQHDLESIVYAVDWNQATDSLFRPAVWLGAGGDAVIKNNLSRPSALICSSRASQRPIIPGSVRSKVQQILNILRQTVSNGGSVLIPADSCAKALEISYYLEQICLQPESKTDRASSSDAQFLRHANLYFASSSASMTLKHAQKVSEWANPAIVKESIDATQNSGNAHNTNDSRGNDNDHLSLVASHEDQPSERNLFNFCFVKTIEQRKQLDKVLALSAPKIIIASDLSLEWGHGRVCFDHFSLDPRNVVVLLEATTQAILNRPTLASLLWSTFRKRSSETPNPPLPIVDPKGSSFTYMHTLIGPLEGNDLTIYQQHLARERESKLTSEAVNTLHESLLDDASSTTSSGLYVDSDDEQQGMQGVALNMSTILIRAKRKAGLSDAELGVHILLAKKGIYDWDVRGKRGRDRLFPPPSSNRKLARADEYGDNIRPEDYMRLDERENEETLIGDENKEVSSLDPKSAKWNQSSATTLVDEMQVDPDVEPDDIRPPDGPVKALFEQKTISLRMRIAFVDFTGLHDKGSIGMLVSLLNPRKLVLVGGNKIETHAIDSECKRLVAAGSLPKSLELFTPVIGESINASLNTNAWNVKLSLPLQSLLRWQRIGNLGIVPLSGQLRVELSQAEANNEIQTVKRVKIDDSLSKGPPATSAPAKKAIPLLDVIPVTALSAAPTLITKPVHVGDLSLSDLRKAMQALGYSTEFRGEGTVVVNDIVAIRKSAIGKIELETVIGVPGVSVTDKTFDEVRKQIYGRLAIISA